MWSFKSHMGSSDPKFPAMQKGCYHTALHAVIGAIIPDKQFPNFINRANTCMHNYKNYNTSSNMDQGLEVNCSQPTHEPVTQKVPIVNNVACNSNKKKKKRRRRRKKKTKNNQPKVGTVKTKQACPPRQRQLSTTSEDSFVIFFDDDNEGCMSELSENETIIEDFDSSDSIIPHKKVRFAADNELCEVHPMVMWSFAYQAARRGPWEEYARDRCRFHKRVVNTEALIGHVFTEEHRSRIYEQRFA